MKIWGFMQQERITAIEERRKMILRKNVGDVYRKNLQYAKPKKNPILIELENLLLGHKDHDLYERHKDEMTTQDQTTICAMQRVEKNVGTQEHIHKAVDGKNNTEIWQVNASDNARKVVESDISIVASNHFNDEEMFDMLESVLRVGVAPVDPSLQEEEACLSSIKIEEIAYLDEQPIEVGIPERFSKELKLDAFADTIFGRSYEELYRESVFKKAAASYTIHSEMAKNGYRPGNEPTFSLTA